MASLHELDGKTLACWCKPHACHGDVLAKVRLEQVLSSLRGGDSGTSCWEEQTPEQELEMKCRVAEQTIADNCFSREEALFFYQITNEQYEKYLRTFLH